MPTATLYPRTNLHGFNQQTNLAIDPFDAGGGVNDFNGFWPVVSPSGGNGNAIPHGTTDVGDAMRIADAFYNEWPDTGVGISGGSQVVIFNDAGAIPTDATINSIQVVARVNASHAGLSTDSGVTGWISIAWGAFLAQVPWPGLTDDVTTGGFVSQSSAVMAVNPSTGAAWTFAELYGNPLDPFGAGSFLGWWNLNPGAGATNLGAQVLQLDFVQLQVVYNDTVPPNLQSSPPWQTAGQWSLHRLDLLPRREGPSGGR